jgi:hypothetical protein
MVTTKKPWIFTQSCNYTPNGKLSLGQILAVPGNPAHMLQPLGPLPLSPSGPKFTYQAIEPEFSKSTNVSVSSSDELTAHFKAWAKLGVIPAQLSAALSTEHLHKREWHFDVLESNIIAPTLEYVKLAMRHGDVPESLSGWKFKHRVYMVTGIRIASGARMVRSDASSNGVQAAAEGTIPDQSASGGASTEVTQKSSDSEEFENATDFVFAYRLNEIRYRGKVTHKPYMGGETASTDKAGQKGVDEIVIEDFEVLKVVEEPFAGDAKNFDVAEVDGHEDLVCFARKGE